MNFKLHKTWSTLSLSVILNLVISLSVISNVFLIDFFNTSTIDPLLPNTLPYLSTENIVPSKPLTLFAATNNLSEQSLVAP